MQAYIAQLEAFRAVALNRYPDLAEPLEPPRYDFVLGMAMTSGNKGQGRHWAHSDSDKTRALEHLRGAGFSVGVRKLTPPDFKQTVTFVRILGVGQRFFDDANCARGNAKQLQDAMTDCGFWHDDTLTWLETDFDQDDTRRADGPAIRVIVRRA